ncbi:MAG: hypothetical protein ABIQ16_18620 [Polyangiaceae bacterium]
MSLPRAALLAGVCAVACAGSPFRGGYARAEAHLPGSKTLRSFIPGHCEDARHVEHPPRFSAVDLVETDSGRIVLLEHRQGHDLLVVENLHSDGPFWVFEVLVDGDHLRRWRIPRSSTGTGSIEVGRELSHVARGEHFEAELASSRARCSLIASAPARSRGDGDN